MHSPLHTADLPVGRDAWDDDRVRERMKKIYACKNSGANRPRAPRTSPEDAADAVLDHARQDLPAEAAHAHVPAGGREVVRPLLLGIAVAAERGR